MKKLAILSSLLLMAMSSCSNEDIFDKEQTNNYEKRISVVAEDLVPTDGTRTSYTDNGNGYSFAWSEGDALGIFPENGYQTIFPIGTNGVGSNTAVFDGGKWALRPNESYAAYYPLIEDFKLAPTAIPVDYTGQVQNGNGSTAHLAKYDYMASTFTEVDAKGNVNFKLQHLGCLVQFKLTMPDADTYSSLDITSDKTPFITSGTYSLSDANHTLQNKTTSNKVTIGLSNVSTTADDKTLIITAMFSPVDLSGSNLTLIIHGVNWEYELKASGQNLLSGKASSQANNVPMDLIPYVSFSATDTQTLTMSSSVNNLEYTVNNGEWQTLGTNTVTFGGSNGILKLRGSNGYGTAQGSNSFSTIRFGTTATVACRGDIRTLADYQNYSTEDTSDDRFYGLFDGCNTLTSAPTLPAVTLAESCYGKLFSGCKSLTTAPALPAETLTTDCYFEMFSGCTSLTSAPALPATTLAEFCYSGMFSGCTSLATAPTLPAETLAKGCYGKLFSGCTSLASAPELPATTLASNCYSRMFSGCTSLTSAPELPATTLASYCYSGMFSSCTSLTSAPELPATTLEFDCYYEMFSGCTSLTSAPALPAETLVGSCYEKLFSGCTSLTTAPALLATKLAPECYRGMFSDCTSLISAPALPATKLTISCYPEMFSGCTSLTSAPELLAPTLYTGCYNKMFDGCSSLNYVKMMATEVTEKICVYNWLRNVSDTGTLEMSVDLYNVLKKAADDIGWKVNDILDLPSGWTVTTAAQ